MQSNNSKKTFRPETEEKGRKRNSQKKQAAAAGVAMTAIAVILLGAGIGYSVQRAGKTESISLEEMQNSVSSALKGEMESAATSLEQLNQNIADNQKKLDEVNAQLAQREESLLQVETIQHRLEENASGMTGKVTDLEKTTHTKVNEIRTDMESIHTDVTKTLEEISRIMQEMDAQKKQDNTDHKESITEINRINESVQSVNQTVSKLEDRLNTSYENLKNLVQEVRTTEEKNRELWTQEKTQLTEQQKQLLKEVEESRQETIRSLALVESNLKNMLESDMVQITAAFGSLTAELQTRVQELSALLENRMNRVDQNLSGLDKNVTGLGNNISGLSENVNGLNENVDGVGKNVESLFTRIGELDNGMQTNLTTLQQTFAKQFGDLNVSAGQNTEELKSYLEELNNGLKQDMNQVFTSVSNGKKKLASALLTKGVSTNEDATFAQLAEAILNIDQKLVIGVEEIPGTIRYQYHYHVDASGKQPHTEKSDTAGGCYTGTHGHVHSVEDGCYKEESYHVHRDDCSGYPVWVDWAPGVEPYWGFIYTCGEPANATRRVLICSKQAGSTDYYVPSCGLADGQIIGAEILYDQAHAQVKAQEEQQCRDELVRLALSMQPALGSNTSETEQIGTDADNIPPAPEQIAAEAERKRQEEAAAEADRREESEGEAAADAERSQESEGEAAADAERSQESEGEAAADADRSQESEGEAAADADRLQEAGGASKSDSSTENVNTTATSATDSQKISEASEN